jgi:long-subunit fatty acid transport protein
MRGLFLDFSPRYSISKTTGASRSNSDFNTLSVSLNARYQIARYIGLVAGYSYLHQTGSGNGNTSGTNGTSNNVDVDQNLVTFGVQFGYPINFY